MKRYSALALTAILAVVGSTGCVSSRQSHGYIIERGEGALAAELGVDTKETILAKYGEPSMIGTFDPNSWYYFSSLDASRAFFRPKVTARSVVSFHFDGDGKVTKVNNVDLADAVDVKTASRVTPTRGKELGFWEQLLGTVGQLPAGALGGDGPTPGGGGQR